MCNRVGYTIQNAFRRSAVETPFLKAHILWQVPFEMVEIKGGAQVGCALITTVCG